MFFISIGARTARTKKLGGGEEEVAAIEDASGSEKPTEEVVAEAGE